MAATRGRPGPKPRPIAERFWSKTEKTAGCWIWMGKANARGYGLFTTTRHGVTTACGAHRKAYELTYGDIPAGLYVLHRCDTPQCVNPAHLFLGDQFENMADASGKGRLVGNARPPLSHCHNGHEKSAGNVYVWNGQHHCMECRRESDRRRRAKKRHRR